MCVWERELGGGESVGEGGEGDKHLPPPLLQSVECSPSWLRGKGYPIARTRRTPPSRTKKKKKYSLSDRWVETKFVFTF